jgi:hypothetical protein
MKTVQHTPGPWKWTYRQVGDGHGSVRTVAVMLETEPAAAGDGVSQSTILAVRDDWIGWMNRDASSGDRALIAAAPMLLHALATLVGIAEMDCMDDKSNVWRTAMLDADAAIAKAEGRD